jgi:SulP family sulfate permease
VKKTLTDAGIAFGFARVPWSTRADFRRHHLSEAIGSTLIFNHLHDAVEAYNKAYPQALTNKGEATESKP